MPPVPIAGGPKIHQCRFNDNFNGLPDGIQFADGPQCGGAEGYAATETRAGSPNSMMFQAASAALDMADIQPEGKAAFSREGDFDMIGAALTGYKAGFQEGERYDLHLQHARRIGEGTRARFLIDLPISIDHTDSYGVAYVSCGYYLGPYYQGGGPSVSGTLSAGIEVPITPNWLVTPRIAYSNSQAGAAFDYDGELATASVTTRYRLPQIGRGDLVFGGMVAYSRTIHTFLSKQPYFTSDDYWTWRGGLAYQMPIKRRMFGRQASIRASYVFTYMTGEPYMAYKQLHELGASIGVRTREAEQKNSFEQMRIGLLYTHAKSEFSSDASYDSVTLTLGYRF